VVQAACGGVGPNARDIDVCVLRLGSRTPRCLPCLRSGGIPGS
jgi:hypothetical protein